MKTIVTPDEIINIINQKGYPIDKNLYCTDNFAWYELLVSQTVSPTLLIANNLKSVATVLQCYRNTIFENRPIVITSGWRSPDYNKILRNRGYKSANRSQHCLGTALDFNVNGLNCNVVYDMLDKVHFGGVEKTGGNWNHIDNRGKNIRFNSKNKIIPDHYNKAEHYKIFHTT